MDRFDTLRDVLALTFGVTPETIAPETRREDCPQWDSLAHLNLVLALEDTFGVTFTVDEIGTLDSVRAILDQLDAALGS